MEVLIGDSPINGPFSSQRCLITGGYPHSVKTMSLLVHRWSVLKPTGRFHIQMTGSSFQLGPTLGFSQGELDRLSPKDDPFKLKLISIDFHHASHDP